MTTVVAQTGSTRCLTAEHELLVTAAHRCASSPPQAVGPGLLLPVAAASPFSFSAVQPVWLRHTAIAVSEQACIARSSNLRRTSPALGTPASTAGVAVSCSLKRPRGVLHPSR